MANTFKMLSLLLTITIAITTTTQAQSPAMAPSSSPSSPIIPEGPMLSPGSAGAPAPGMDCMDALLNLSSCLTYVEAGSNLTVPETGCCPGLSGLVDSQPICLCQLLANGGDAFGVKIDTSKALMLPKACKVQTPPVSLCSAVGIPVASPTGPSAAPASGGPEVPGSTPTAAPAGSTSGNTGTTTRATSTLVTLISLLLTIAISF